MLLGGVARPALEQPAQIQGSDPSPADLPGTLPGSSGSCLKRRGRAVADVVMGALLWAAGAHRQQRRGPVQRLDLGLRAPRGAVFNRMEVRGLYCRSVAAEW